MIDIFGFLILAAFLFLIIGLISPKRGLFWFRGNRTRRKVLLFYGIGVLVAFIGFGIVTPKVESKEALNQKDQNSSDSLSESNEIKEHQGFEKVSKKGHQETKSNLFKEFTSYYANPYTKSGYEDIRTYYYGVYLNLPNDTTGISNKIINYLSEKTYNKGDVIHIWLFTDSVLIPKSFNGNWSTAKSRKKCFAHAVRLSNGSIVYDYDIFEEFEK